MLLHVNLGGSPLLACEMPKVKPPVGFEPELWTSLAHTPKSFIGSPFGTLSGYQLPYGKLCMGPRVLWVHGDREASIPQSTAM